MPTVEKTNKPATMTVKPSKKKKEVRPILYPELDAAWQVGDKSITEEQAVGLLDMETESQYAKRVLIKKPKASKKELEFGDEFMFKLNGEKVQCWNNNDNRPFDEQHAQKLAQELLNRHWAGTIGFEGETVNCETVVIGTTGKVISGQHRLIGLVFACDAWRKDEHWHALWPEKPTLPTLICFGACEDPRLTRTVDNVKPRTFADTVYTSETFKDLGMYDRKECSRMLGYAVDLLWKRLRLSDLLVNKFEHFQTASTNQSFVDRHKTLIKCVRHIFDCNRARRINLSVDISPGQCAAMMYLMAASGSDGKVYRNLEVQSEKNLDLKAYDKAEEFWTLVAGESPDTAAVGRAIAALTNPETGAKGRPADKRAIIALAWQAFAEEGRVKPSDVKIKWEVDEDGESHHKEVYSFNGIDLGDPRKDEASVGAAQTADQEVEAEAQESPVIEEEENADEERKATKQSTAARLQAEIEARKKEQTNRKNGETVKPVGKRQTRKDVEAEQTRKAREADEEEAREAALEAEEAAEEEEVEEEIIEDDEEGELSEEEQAVLEEEETEE